MQNYLANGFDEDQKIEIEAGISMGLDTFYYARPEFMAIQMRQIRMGLIDGLDVTVYNRPEYDWFQMEEIRKGLKANINYRLYANPDIDYTRMRQIRKGLEQGIDLSAFIRLEAGILEELRNAIASGVNIVEFIKEGYSVSQLREIRLALEKKQNIKSYINKYLLAPSIREISLGLESGLAVENYANMDYSWQQMREIRLGMEGRLDITQYNNSLYTWQQMRELRLGLEEGIDIAPFRSFAFMPADMAKMRQQLLLDEAVVIANRVTDEQTDKVIQVFVSQDEMEVCVELKKNAAVEVTEADIRSRLKFYGVTSGIVDAEIQEMVKKKKYNKTIVVAKGVQPEPGEDGYYEFFFDTHPDHTPKILEDGSADFTQINWCELVRENQKIAYYHEATGGKDGYTVTGRVLKAKKGKEKAMISGQGFRLLEDNKTYVANLDGKIELIGDHRMDITRVCILEGVNMNDGYIQFDGTIYVMGNVERGSSIYATEDIVVNGYVEAANIRADGNMCLQQGVNGGGYGRLEAKGNIVGQFFESVSVVTQADISAHYCLNCDINAGGTVTIYGLKGLLLGGYTRAARGIVAYNVGNKAGLTTVLSAGIDHKSMNDMWALEGRIKNVDKELTILRNSYQDFQRKYSPEVRNSMEMYLKIENAIYTKELQMQELVKERDQLDSTIKEMTNARVVVGGTMYEGVQITIDNLRWNSHMLIGVVIRCRSGKIIVESN